MVCVTRDRGNAASSRPLCKFLQAGGPRRAVGEELSSDVHDGQEPPPIACYYVLCRVIAVVYTLIRMI